MTKFSDIAFKATFAALIILQPVFLAIGYNFF